MRIQHYSVPATPGEPPPIPGAFVHLSPNSDKVCGFIVSSNPIETEVCLLVPMDVIITTQYKVHASFLIRDIVMSKLHKSLGDRKDIAAAWRQLCSKKMLNADGRIIYLFDPTFNYTG